ncbi:MAG TPA: PASTA domain-containing protein [Chitinophagaceae bacterium]|nr:PASTA domain-containing protein [Chitinophagaceae bacterium]
MLKFITHRPLWLNIVTGVLLAIAVFSVFILSLNWLTHHGRSTTVPSVTGKTYDEAEKLLTKSGFDVEIQDSIYVVELPPLVVIKQIPEGDDVVKTNRTVYLTINRAVPPMVEMPNLIGYSFRNAEMVLKNMGLRVGDTTFKPDFAKNSVLEQWYNGAIVTAGTRLRMGSSISLVLGDGVGKTEFAVPMIVGLTFGQAKALLEANGLVMGVVIAPGVSDTMNAYINKQVPERYDDEKHIQHIRPGQTMDVFLQVEKPVTDSTDLHLPE